MISCSDLPLLREVADFQALNQDVPGEAGDRGGHFVMVIAQRTVPIAIK